MYESDPILRNELLAAVFNSLKRLPGLGPRSARKLAIFLAEDGRDSLDSLLVSLTSLQSRLKCCQVCNVLSESDLCWRCGDDNRNDLAICVVANHMNLFAIEDAQVFDGNYHLLGGQLVGQGTNGDHLKLDPLLRRTRDSKVKEVVLALDYTYEGQLTCDYLRRALIESNPELVISRLASGIPVGGELTYADEGTLQAAFTKRSRMV